MNHASGTVAPLDPELIQVGDAIGQRAQRRLYRFKIRRATLTCGFMEQFTRPGGTR